MVDEYSFQMNFIALLCIILLCGMVGTLITGLLHTFRLAKYCVCPRYPDINDVSFYRLLLFFFQIINFWSDIYLLYTLYWMTTHYSFKIHYLSITIVLLIILITISLINFIFVYKWLINWFYSNSNPVASTWLYTSNTNHWFYALLILCGSVYHTILIVNCKLFGVNRTNMGLSNWTINKICRNKYISWLFYIYSMSMLIIEGITCILIPGAYIINILSTVTNVLSMAIIFISSLIKNGSYYDYSDGSEITYFQLNVECSDHHNDDEYKLINTKEMRIKWRDCIKIELENLDTNNNNIRLQIVCVMDSKNPNNQKFTVYGVCLDLDSYWMQLMEICIANKSIANKIKEEFELDALPQCSLLANDCEMSIIPKEPNAQLQQHFLFNSVDQ
eukprot:75161_1